MKMRPFLGLSVIALFSLAPRSSLAQESCKTTLECAQRSLQVAAQAKADVINLQKQLDAVKDSLEIHRKALRQVGVQIWAKPGNNGTVNCNTFCGNSLGQNWGPIGACVGGQKQPSGHAPGDFVSCEETTKVDGTMCWCRTLGVGATEFPSDISKALESGLKK